MTNATVVKKRKMSSPKQIHQRLQPLLNLPTLQGMVRELVIKEETNLLGIKEDEFTRGERPDGSRIGYYASTLYKARKERLNPFAGGKVDLILTGAFVRSAYLTTPRSGLFGFGFSDSKAPDLLGKYNKGDKGQKSIQNINQGSWERFQKEVIAPRFLRQIKQQLGQR